ncbi:MAG: LytTR family DNA-binding domain-containing protein [Eubacteriales bacterium]|nr:LytTR family DNA-binding domain-containing protein [Eubacteriales bacterium]
MRIGICDDERELRLALKKVIEPQLQLMGAAYEIEEYASGEELLGGISGGGPEILFLDIEMGTLNGMEAARALRRTCPDTVLIFVTAYPDFVFQGYEVHAFHYLLKPYREEKIKEVLRLAVEAAGARREQYYLVEQKSGSYRLPLGQVRYFRSERRKTEAHLAEETLEFYGKLSDLEAELPDYFVRSHNRYLVNLNYVTRLEGTFCICGGEEIPVSRACRQELATAFARSMLG